MSHEVVTFGCRLNIYESEVIKNALIASGSENVIVFNTCTVTKEAERQARQAIRRAKREFPDKKIIVTGCAAQLNPHSFAIMPEVDKVIGNEEKLDPKNYDLLSEEKILVNNIMSVTETAEHLVSSFEGMARAFLQVQNGCNHRCTFCTIPFARGNSRSVPVGGIVTQVQKLVDEGYQEVVITGVDITDYGLDLPGKPSLAQMIRRLLTLVPSLMRLRLSSIDVAEIDDELFELIAYEPRIMPHIHISLQSGDDMILKRMKRRHKRADVIDFCHKLRSIRPDVAYGADIIAGFPTESAEMFANSLDLIEQAGLQYLHVFPYSERDNTPAARMPQVLKAVRKERAALLRSAGDLQLLKFLQQQIGSDAKILVEQDALGRTENFLPVKLKDGHIVGAVIEQRVTDVQDRYLV